MGTEALLPLAGHLAYASFVIPAARIVYVETPKAACTTFKRLWHQLYPREVADDFYLMDQSSLAMNVHSRQLHACVSLHDLHQDMLDAVLHSQDWMRFAVVRNPYQRLFSCWRDKVYGHEPGFIRHQPALLAALTSIVDPIDHFRAFSQWVLDRNSANHHWQPMNEWLCCDHISYTHLIKVESLAQQITPVLERLQIEWSQFKELEANQALMPLPQAPYYDDDLAARVYQYYRQDFALFDYDADAWQSVGRGPRFVPRDEWELPSYQSHHQTILQAIRSRNQVIALLNQKLSATLS